MEDYSIMISLIIPVYNEEKLINSVFTSIKKELDKTKEYFEIIFIDDGSVDNTWNLVKELSRKYPMLRALRLSRNYGKEAALAAGLEMAKGKAIIVMDGDFQHPPTLIPEMVRLWRQSHADIVEAVKYGRGNESLTKKIGAKLFYAILSKLTGYDLKGASDFKLMDRKVLNAWLRMGEHNLFFRGMSAWLGFNRVQIPFVVPERTAGQSKWSKFNLIRLSVNAITSFSSLPLQLVTITGLIFLLFSIIFAAYTIVLWAIGISITGFSTVIILLLIIGSLLMISLGIIGEYVAKIYEEVKGRPRYIVVEKIDGPISY